MSEIPDAALAKARELMQGGPRDVAAFVQQVSDVAKEVVEAHDHYSCTCTERGPLKQSLAPFILTEPLDPLDAVFAELPCNLATCVDDASARFRAELAKAGLKIVPAA